MTGGWLKLSQEAATFHFSRSAYQCRFKLDVHHVEDGSDIGGVPEDAAGIEIQRANGLRVHAEVGKLALGQLIKQRVVGRQGRRIHCRG